MVLPTFGGHVGKKVVGLPAVVYGLEQLELVLDVIFHARNDISSLRLQQILSSDMSLLIIYNRPDPKLPHR